MIDSRTINCSQIVFHYPRIGMTEFDESFTPEVARHADSIYNVIVDVWDPKPRQNLKMIEHGWLQITYESIN